MAVVERVSHRVAVMYLGEIVEIGPRQAVFENPQHAYTKTDVGGAGGRSVAPAHRFAVDDRRNPEPAETGGLRAAKREYQEVDTGHFVQVAAYKAGPAGPPTDGGRRHGFPERSRSMKRGHAKASRSKKHYPLAARAAVVDALSETGLSKIQVASFVSPSGADHGRRRRIVSPPLKEAGVTYTPLYLNAKGFERARQVSEVDMEGRIPSTPPINCHCKTTTGRPLRCATIKSP